VSLNPLECQSQGGTFQGVGTSCGSVNCPQPTGACCLSNGNCLVLTQSDCALIGGSTWKGPATNCSDGNGNGQADACEATACPGDTNGDNVVNNIDLQAVLDGWMTSTGNPNYNPNADFNSNGVIANEDLQVILDNWARTCP
jgi:hypothetical protein